MSSFAHLILNPVLPSLRGVLLYHSLFAFCLGKCLKSCNFLILSYVFFIEFYIFPYSYFRTGRVVVSSSLHSTQILNHSFQNHCISLPCSFHSYIHTFPFSFALSLTHTSLQAALSNSSFAIPRLTTLRTQGKESKGVVSRCRWKSSPTRVQ